VQISHNVSLGKKTTISSQTGVSGSVDVGENVIMAGQVGLVDHISIGDNVIIAAKCGVSKNIEDKRIIAGIPHQDLKDWRKSIVIVRQLEKYIDRIKKLEYKIKELEEK
jgi:UDP-3-O-[3-hydroxymyristoyl] glucosamine N-acyltransferase